MLSRPGWSSSPPIQSLLAKSARGHVGDFPKHAGEMTLVGEAELSRDIAKQSSLSDQLLCLGHAFVDNVAVRRRAEGV